MIWLAVTRRSLHHVREGGGGGGGRRRGGRSVHRLLRSHHSPNLLTSQPCFLSWNWFFECEHPFINKPMVLTESAVPSTRPLGLGWKLYPSNMQRMLNKDLPRFIQSLSRARQNRASDRKVLLTGLTSPWYQSICQLVMLYEWQSTHWISVDNLWICLACWSPHDFGS